MEKTRVGRAAHASLGLGRTRTSVRWATRSWPRCVLPHQRGLRYFDFRAIFYRAYLLHPYSVWDDLGLAGLHLLS